MQINYFRDNFKQTIKLSVESIKSFGNFMMSISRRRRNKIQGANNIFAHLMLSKIKQSNQQPDV